MTKQFGIGNGVTTPLNKTSNINWSEVTLESLKLKDLFYYCIGASVVSYSMYFGIGGFLHVSMSSRQDCSIWIALELAYTNGGTLEL